MTFEVEGTCTQAIDVPDDCPLSCEDIVACLNGKLMAGSEVPTNAGTKLAEGSQVVQYAVGGNRTVGQIVKSELGVDFDNFQLRSIDYTNHSG